MNVILLPAFQDIQKVSVVDELINWQALLPSEQKR
jgi:hypothetical protein